MQVGGHAISTSLFVPQHTGQMSWPTPGHDRFAFRCRHKGHDIDPAYPTFARVSTVRASEGATLFVTFASLRPLSASVAQFAALAA
jgi:hypothetical protein